MRDIRRIAVFCGSNAGNNAAYAVLAKALGSELARQGISLVYGGTHKGLMGVLADSALAGGTSVHGVITQRLFDLGHLHRDIQMYEIFDDMKSRKAHMLELADACIALPGGIGTTEEFMEVWTLNQLSLVDKPVGLLNINGFYDPFLLFLEKMVKEGFLPRAHSDGLIVSTDPSALIDALRRASPITASKWVA